MHWAIKSTSLQTLKLLNNNLKLEETEALKNILKDANLKIVFFENYVWGDKDEFIKAL